MKNKDALITKAMLASYISEQRVDYLDLISPFVLKSLPDKVGTIINVHDVADNVNSNYGIDIKQKIVEKILIRLCKDKYGNLIRRETIHGASPRNTESSKNYYVNKIIDNSKFDKRKESMNRLIIEVVNKLKDYINNTYNIIPISYEQAQKYFLDFLNDYNYELYSNGDDIRKIRDLGKNDKNNNRVANFILNEYKSTNGCYTKIKTIQEGYFVSVAIYYFCNSSYVDNPKKIIENTKIILDTRLLIDVLGLNRETESLSMSELINLINTNNGKLYTFSYYVDELAGIIHKYASDSNSRLLLDLDYFRRKKCSNVEVLLWRDTLVEKLKNRGVEIIRDVDYSEQIKEMSWHIDLLELKRNMSSFIDYKQGTSSQVFENDYETLQRISFYKSNNVKHGLPKAIFVTSNIGIIKAAEKTFTDIIFQDDIKLVISDIDLAATLWLSNYNPDSNLSDLVLLENAYAASSPSKNIISEVLRIIDGNINSKNEEVRNDAILLRYKNEYLLDDIAELIQNDEEFIDDSLQNRLINRFGQRISENIRPDLERQVREQVEKQVEERIFQDVAMDKKRSEEIISEKESSIIEIEKFADLQSIEILKLQMETDLRSVELEDSKKINKELKEKYEEIKLREMNKIEKTAESISTKVYQICLVLYGIGVIWIAFQFVRSLKNSLLSSVCFLSL